MVYRWRNTLRSIQVQRHSSAVRAQALVRRFLSRCRLPEKQRRRFTLKLNPRQLVRPATSSSSSARAVRLLTNVATFFTGDWPGDIDPKFTTAGRERRMGMLFLNLKLGDLKHFETLDKAAKTIQKVYRRRLHRIWRQRAMVQRRAEAERRIARWYRHQCWLQGIAIHIRDTEITFSD